MRVLVVDAFPAAAIEELRREGFEVRHEPDCKGDALARAIAGQNVLVVRSTEVGRGAIEAADALHLILRAGAGVNTIDRAAASERGIYVSNCPGKNAVAVAEL